jgi:pantoate--beta-alanine ligase
MIILKTILEMQAEADRLRSAGKRIGFVPTMGFLHEGHMSLVRMAKLHADAVVMSVYVNPLQFGPLEDFTRYPRDPARDEALARREGVDVLFCPADAEMYPAGHKTTVNVEAITEILCGASRPGHFQGVTTVVAKLFLAVKPHCAVFGQKDAQQAVVVRRMTQDLNFAVDILVAPILREPDGLAMSSRNAYLSAEERRSAVVLSRSLEAAETLIREGERDTAVVIGAVRRMIAAQKHARVDYVAVVDPDTLMPLDRIESRALILLAVFVGATRLIDNTVVQLRPYDLDPKIRLN